MSDQVGFGRRRRAPRLPRAARRAGRMTRALPYAAALGIAAIAVAGCSSSPTPGPTTVHRSGADTTATGTGTSDDTGLIPPDGGDGNAPATSTGPAAPEAPGPPDVAMLAWLSGAETDDGVVIPTDTGQRWQGPSPTEYALVADGGYRWFGPGGAMIDCVTKGGCLAVDGSGNVAVTTGPDSARTVFHADGTFRGRFAADGTRLTDPPSVPGMADAIASTGLSLADLVNTATLGEPFAGGATGDPHLITTGGFRYSTQATGQFVARTGDPAHTIQLEFSPMLHRDDVSVVSAVAIGAGSDVVIVGQDGSVQINGLTRLSRDTFEQITLSDGVVVGRWPTADDRSRAVAVVWPNGATVVMQAHPALGVTVVARMRSDPGVSGLFGTAAEAGRDRPDTDLLTEGGDQRDTDVVIESWRARASERLFGTAPTEEKRAGAPAPEIDPGAMKVAEAACRGQGFTGRDDLSACAFDVGLTGDTGFVTGHQQMALSAENPLVAPSFAKRWPALTERGIAGPEELPGGGELDFTLAAGASKSFAVNVQHTGAVALVNRSGCGIGEDPPGMDQPAMRLFDAAGHAVSDRFPLCGHEQSLTVTPGTYHLVVANGPDGKLPVRVDVSVP